MTLWIDESLDKQKNFHFDHVFTHNPIVFDGIKLFQVGDLSCKEGYVVGEHKQFCYEISYIVSGRGSFYMNKEKYTIQAGDIILNLPEELHDCRADQGQPFRYFYVGFYFDIDLDEDHIYFPIKKMFDQTQKCVEQNKQGIDVPFMGIFNEFINLKGFSWSMIESYLRQIIVLTHRSLFDSLSASYSPGMKSEESKNIVYEVINYIDINWHQITDLTQISNEMNYSYSYLSHIFSKEAGMTMINYYNHKRFEKAVEWLKEGEFTVTQIAEKLQYQSIHTFSKAFRKKFGISPTVYQNLFKNTNKEQIIIKKG